MNGLPRETKFEVSLDNTLGWKLNDASICAMLWEPVQIQQETEC